MAYKPLKVIVFMGSVRDGRNAERVSKFVTAKLQEAKYDVDVWDPQELPLPMSMLQVYLDPSQAPRIVRDMNEKIKAADAYVILTPEYNRQLPPALTNLIDYFPPLSYICKTSAIVCYSMGSGGFVAASQARTLMVEMGAPPIPYVLSISRVMQSLDESGNARDEYLHKAATKMITQLDWYADAMRNQRELGMPNWDSPLVSKDLEYELAVEGESE